MPSMKKINSVTATYLLGVLMLLVSPESFSLSLFGKQTYEECILENMKGVTNDRVAQQIQSACAVKTQDDSKSKPLECRGRNLTQEENKLVSATAEYSKYDNKISLKVYNGNRNLTLGYAELNVKKANKNYVYKVNGLDLGIEPLKVGVLSAHVLGVHDSLFEESNLGSDNPFAKFTQQWKLVNMQAVICQ